MKVAKTKKKRQIKSRRYKQYEKTCRTKTEEQTESKKMMKGKKNEVLKGN